eukprot:TRINITY_DN23369_c0_g1_i1.p4 TRINITY_DN23369_c0_g1~~TRINITY_DN23369_c0_g1_i1.p4  ORF type:complete len:142 (+),score=0.61 TRINITY_DN23369_c0_g1_i1:173-598(+)
MCGVETTLSNNCFHLSLSNILLLMGLTKFRFFNRFQKTRQKICRIIFQHVLFIRQVASFRIFLPSLEIKVKVIENLQPLRQLGIVLQVLIEEKKSQLQLSYYCTERSLGFQSKFGERVWGSFSFQQFLFFLALLFITLYLV